jgi:2-polyprenyl-3-methyl-5-hydroxy-6-metoxy-1,4-benzoquinol methylase
VVDEKHADWAAQWPVETLSLAVVRAEARTPRWRAQERTVRERLGGFEGLQAIEIGAGRGTNAQLYAERGAAVTLLDELDLPLAQARQLFAEAGLEVATVQGDVFNLPAGLLGRFDVSMSFGLCEHFLGPRRLAVIRAHLDLLRPGGIAFIGVPNRWSPVYRAWKKALELSGSWPFGTEVPFSASEAATLARAAGGEPLAPAYGSFVGSVVNQGVNQLLHKLGRPVLPVPQTRVPVLDRLAYELLVPVVRPA